jgi:hypothetical protein
VLPLVGPLARRVGFLPKLQIFDAVVVADAVAMMDALGGSQATPKMLRHHEAVFEHPATTLSHVDEGAVVGQQDAHVALTVALPTVPVHGASEAATRSSVAKLHARGAKDPVYCHRVRVESNRKFVTRAVVAGVASDYFLPLCI